MRVLLDEDVHIKVRDWLLARGHEVIRVPSGLKNGEVIALARRESRMLITRDRDFANRLLYPPAQTPGIVILQIHPPRLEALVAALQSLFGALTEAQFAGKLVIVEQQGYHLLS